MAHSSWYICLSFAVSTSSLTVAIPRTRDELLLISPQTFPLSRSNMTSRIPIADAIQKAHEKDSEVRAACAPIDEALLE